MATQPARPLLGLLLGVALLGCNGERSGDRPSVPFLFVDVSDAAGLDVVQVGGGPDVDHIIESVGPGGAWLDFDADGDPDLYLAQGATPDAPHDGPPDRLLRNDGDTDGDGVPEFTDVTETAGLGDRLWSFGVAVADVDDDGDPDLYLCNWGRNRLYLNDGNGRFTDVATAAGLDDSRWTASAVWGDVDRDGDLDLYLAQYVEFAFGRYPARGERDSRGSPPCAWKGAEVFCGPRNLEAAQDALYRNDGDTDGDGVPEFTDVTRQAGLFAPSPHYGLAAHFFDADDDGDDDLYVANDSVQNTFFVNRGDGTFDEVAILSGLAYNEQGHEQAGMGITSGDYNGDGRTDLAVTNFSHDHDTLYRNDGALLFTDVSYPAGIGSPSYLTLGWGIAFVDLDHDGWEDLYVAHGHVYPQIDEEQSGSTFRQRDALFRNLGDGTFEDVAEQAGPGLIEARSSRALLPVDLEGDGDVDLLVTQLGERPVLLRNDGAPGHWLQVRLRAGAGNRDALGARVSVTVGGRTLVREVRRNTSFAGSTLPVAHFGLGAHSRIDALEVRWPSGAITRQGPLEADRQLLLDEPPRPE